MEKDRKKREEDERLRKEIEEKRKREIEEQQHLLNHSAQFIFNILKTGLRAKLCV